jgi:hypothetical protein
MALLFPTTPTPGQQYIAPNGITYTWDNTLGVWTGGAGGGSTVTAASLAEAAAGTINTKYSSPQTAVPKDASGMTGAALLPIGTQLQRPSTPVAGMLRMNTTLSPDSLEVYDGTAATWRPLSYGSATPTGLTNLTISANGPLVSGTFNNYTVNAGVTASLSGLTVIVAYGNVNINGTIDGVASGILGPIQSSGATGITGAGAGPIPGSGLGGGRSGGNLAVPVSIGGSLIAPDYLLGSSGGAGTVYGFDSVSVESEGGAAGGSLIIRCYGTLTVGGSAVINVSGGNGMNAANGGVGSGGGGGGSGGLIYLQGETLSIAGTLTANGGNGSNAVGGYGGGGGGGGGYIIKVSPSVITDTSTKSVAGGSFGSSISEPGSGGAGGGFGGAGGANGVAGSAGQILTNYFL